MKFYSVLLRVGVVGVCFSISLARAGELPFSSKPSDQWMAQVKDDLGSGDEARIAHGVEQIRLWSANGNVSINLVREWEPELLNTRHYREAADLAMGGAAMRATLDGIEPLLEFRAKALLALNKPDEALVAAKSYYNVCQLKDMGNAVTLVGNCLAAAHPEDAGIAARFRNDQAMASAAAYGTTRPSIQVSILKSIQIDPAPYKDAIDMNAERTHYSDPAAVACGNLMLAADRAEEAEGVFRKLYESAKTQDQLTAAIDGIARSLRAEDGNVGRADAWLLAL